MCVLYVQVGDRDGTWDYEVAMPFTSGRLGRVVEGMWGVFVEPDGRERHAQVRRLVLHPISLRDAIVSPFRRLSEALEGAMDSVGAVRAPTTLDRLLFSESQSSSISPGTRPASGPSYTSSPVPSRRTSMCPGLHWPGLLLSVCCSIMKCMALMRSHETCPAGSLASWITYVIAWR